MQEDKPSELKPSEAVTKMQKIAQRLFSTTPQLINSLEPNSMLRRDKPEKTKEKKRQDAADKIMASKAITTASCFNTNIELVIQIEGLEQKVLRLQKELEQNKLRYGKRQLQFRKHIEELQAELKGKSSLEGEERGRMSKIVGLHGQIMDNINMIQKNTSRILIQQESEIIHLFNKKIQEIKDRFRRERIDKGERDQEYIQKEKQLVSELQWIKNIAQKIDAQNHNLMRKYLDLKSQFQILENDRENLFKQLIIKKKKNVLLKAKIETYEGLLKELEEEKAVPPPPEAPSRPPTAHVPKLSVSNTPKAENIVQGLKAQLEREKKKVRELKMLYMGELEGKSEIQKVLRECIAEVKEQLLSHEAELRMRRQKEGILKESRQQIIQRLVNHERILALIYDKTFFLAKQQQGSKFG